MSIHEDEVGTDVALVERLLRGQHPELADAGVTLLGSGTDNTMYRLGRDLLIRLPRTAETVAALEKELRWLPHLSAHLDHTVPTPLHVGEPTAEFPLPWAIYRWIDGDLPSAASVTDWATYGKDLASFVAELHAIDVPSEESRDGLSWYRGGLLPPHDEWVRKCLAEIAQLNADVDTDVLARYWSEALQVPPPTAPHVWLHGDLRPSNVLVSAGRLRAVIDFGGLSVGLPDAEHAPIWDLPAVARDTYRAELALDEPTWLRARAWAIMVGASGVPYYWETYPDFADECLRRLQAIVHEGHR